MSELEELKSAGYSPSPAADLYCPPDIQAVQQRVEAKRQAE
ncbi:hypothetical protein WN982_28875 [Paraburkholderia sp. IMGN_8]